MKVKIEYNKMNGSIFVSVKSKKFKKAIKKMNKKMNNQIIYDLLLDDIKLFVY